MNKLTIAIGCDHAGYPYKKAIIAAIKKQKYHIIDKGTNSPDSVDYPDFVHPVANTVEEGKADLGILLCGSGNGVAMTANKHQGIRAALCWKKELAALAKQHNNANILCIPVRFVSQRLAVMMVNTFLQSKFEGGRHQRRVNKISC